MIEVDAVPIQPKQHLDMEAVFTFVTVVEQGSFSAAAAVLYKTPSAISHRIKSLEDALGIQLLERTTHSTAPTEAGKRLMAKAQYMLDLHQSLFDEFESIKLGVEPSYTIVFNNLLYDAAAAARLLEHLRDRFRTTTFSVRQSVFMGVWDYLIYDRGSIAIGTPSFHSIHEDFVTTPLGLIDWALVCAPGHPCLSAAAEAGGSTEEALRIYPTVNVEDTSTHTQGRPSWRLNGQDEFIVPDLKTKMKCFEEGLGFGFLPRSLVTERIRCGTLVELQATGVFRQPSPMSLARPKNRTGIITQYVEQLVANGHDLVKPFLAPLTVQ